MSIFISDSIGLVLIGASVAMLFFLKRANMRPIPAAWMRVEMPTLLVATLAVGFFAIGLGVMLDASF